MNRWQTVKGFFRKEFIQALRDPRMRIMLFVTPAIQMLIFGLALSSDVKNIKLSAHYEMKDQLMMEIVRDALGGGWFIKGDEMLIQEVSGFNEIRAGKAEVALYAPEGGLTQSMIRSRGHLQALIDSEDIMRSRTMNNYITSIVTEATSDFLGESLQPAISFKTRILYNPELISAFYLVPGVMSMIICMITIMLTSMSIAKEKEMGTFETLVSAPISSMEILLGKTIPFLIIGSTNLPLIMGVAIIGFDVPMRGSILSLLLATLFFLITTVSIGTLISTIAKSQQQAMMGGFIFLMPAILLSGMMFPVENMPPLMRALGYLNPLMYYMTLLRNIMLKGGDQILLWQYTGALALISAVCVGYAVKRFRLHLG